MHENMYLNRQILLSQRLFSLSSVFIFQKGIANSTFQCYEFLNQCVRAFPPEIFHVYKLVCFSSSICVLNQKRTKRRKSYFPSFYTVLSFDLELWLLGNETAHKYTYTNVFEMKRGKSEMNERKQPNDSLELILFHFYQQKLCSCLPWTLCSP